MPWKPSASTLCCFHFAATWLNLRLKCVSHRVAPFEVPVPLTHTRTDTHRRAHSSKSQKCFYLFVQWLLWGLWKHASLAERHKDGKYHITLNACLECESKRDVNLHYFGDDSRTSMKMNGKKIAGVLCLGQSKNEKKKGRCHLIAFFPYVFFNMMMKTMIATDCLVSSLQLGGLTAALAQKKKKPRQQKHFPPWGPVFHD